MMHFLPNMSDASTKQNLCVMPMGKDQKPKDRDSIKDGDFYLINGQHSVRASFMMQKRGYADVMTKEFRKWNCFIVWTKNEEILRSISAYYNRVNHFDVIKPLWATNILGTRQVWKNLGCPKNPKEAVEVRRVVHAARNKAAHLNNKKFKVMTIQLEST